MGRDDLCLLGGFPGPLRELPGVWIEETVALYDGEGNGRAYYVATCPNADYPDDLYWALVRESGITPVFSHLPAGVQATRRGDIAFVMSYAGRPVEATLPEGADLLTGENAAGAD